MLVVVVVVVLLLLLVTEPENYSIQRPCIESCDTILFQLSFSASLSAHFNAQPNTVVIVYNCMNCVCVCVSLCYVRFDCITDRRLDKKDDGLLLFINCNVCVCIEVLGK